MRDSILHQGDEKETMKIFWKTHPHVPLLLILALSFAFRVFFLGTVPNGLWQDETTTGYDAYSLAENLRNQYGDVLPLFSKAFSDHNESFYRFVAAIFVKILGLSVFTIRLPAAVAGILTVYALYLLVKEEFGTAMGLTSACLLAISPWHVVLSRIAFRAILFPCVFCFGVFLFLKGRKNPLYLPISAFILGLSLYTYSAARAVVPVFVLGLIIIYGKDLLHHKKYAVISGVLFAGIFIALAFFWFSPKGMARANSLLTFNLSEIIRNYWSYFSPSYLFSEGDLNIRHSPSNIGQLYYIEFITLFTGLFFLIKNILVSQKERRFELLLLFWLFLYPFPAALTAPGHALRSIIGAPLFAMMSSYGICQVAKMFKTHAKTVYVALGMAFAVNCVIFMHTYFFYDAKHHALEFWQYGLEQAINYTEESNYQRIFVSDRFNKVGMNEPYKYIHIFLAFYTRYPPASYQKAPIDPSTKTQYSLGKYYIGNTKSFLHGLEAHRKYLLMIRPHEIDLVKKFYTVQEVKTIQDPRNADIITLLTLQERISEE